MKIATENYSYLNRFQSPESVESYVDQEYAAKSYASAVWILQIPILAKLLKKIRQSNTSSRHLDFACGTGRITRLAETIFAEVDALDISPAMVEKARTSCQHARFNVGNILQSAHLCPGPYASITTFRLILNLDPQLRIPILAQLHRRLTSDGTLIFNVHGNRHSLRQPAILLKRWRGHLVKSENGQMLNDMSKQEVDKYLDAAGFRVERVYGTGILPPSTYRWPFQSFWRRIDAWLSRVSWLNRFAIDLIFVCKKKELVHE